jgi:hypothetical protein
VTKLRFLTALSQHPTEPSMKSSKPFQSVLIPFEEEIRQLRRRRPPVSYAGIAHILNQRHGIAVTYNAVFNFVKVRSKGKRTGYLFGPPWHGVKNSLPPQGKTPLVLGHRSNSDIPQGRKAEDALSRPRRRVAFTFSEQYNLTRLTPEEAAALEKKLDEELKGES